MQVRLVENPEVGLACTYAPMPQRQAIQALLSLDDTLSGVLRGAGIEPMLVQMRLTWWRDRLIALDHEAPAEVPVLKELALHLVTQGVTGQRLSELVEGWEMLLDAEELNEDELDRFAACRGGRFFEIAAGLFSSDPDARVVEAGKGWALADLARHVSNLDAAERARMMAEKHLGSALSVKWPGTLRAISALAVVAGMDVSVPVDQAIPHGSPRRVARLAWHRMTGR